jgi:hypothetical protein
MGVGAEQRNSDAQHGPALAEANGLALPTTIIAVY